jgi:methylglutamate dehydrogenase subunit A
VATPAHVPYLIIGAGMHGLSTAWHLARELEARGTGSGADILVVDKTGIGAGASGIACGTIRNNYFQPAMRELMAHCVSVWESDPEAFSYHPVGFLQAAPEAMHEDVVQIFTEQQAIGYDSVLIEGEDACRGYMLDMFPDWQATRTTTVLHEKQGGYANNKRSLEGLAGKARALGVRIETGVEVTGLRVEGGAVTAAETSRGPIACDHVVIGGGPWVRDFWAMLDLPDTIDITDPAGNVHPGQPMWTYWALQEGTLEVDPGAFKTSSGGFPPVVHLDSDVPLTDDIDGSPITDEMWGIYFKPDFSFGGVQGGAAPYVVQRPAADVRVDPYGTASPEFVVGEDFTRMWTSGLAHALKRFESQRHLYRKEPSGGIGAFTPDSFPVFDTFCQNAYVIADSNHGYKMIGVGSLVARELVGDRQALLEPFRFSRYSTGKLHPVSHSPFPWS